MLEKPFPEEFPISPPLPLPIGLSEQRLFDFVKSVRVENAPEAEMQAYASMDFRRFVYTWNLARGVTGSCLELGGNPYFTTMLLKKFTNLEVKVANYFGLDENGPQSQRVMYNDLESGRSCEETIQYEHFNIEENDFPYGDQKFDVVIFAEILEHLLNDPCRVLREIKRVLNQGGSLVLTTPNVARLENVARMLSGSNIYDPYSGYGPYGRHNREYNRHELCQLLEHEGFVIEECFTADVHPHYAGNFFSIDELKKLLKDRYEDLGQYIFIKASSVGGAQTLKRPAWLYRSYPESELD
jgi:SAM-dependent methyltransferase